MIVHWNWKGLGELVRRKFWVMKNMFITRGRSLNSIMTKILAYN